MLKPGEHIVERTCSVCGAAWLLTRYQAKFKADWRHGTHGVMAGDAAHPGGAAPGPGPGPLDNPEIGFRDSLHACPVCQSREFTDRKVTKDDPASPKASRNALP